MSSASAAISIALEARSLKRLSNGLPLAVPTMRSGRLSRRRRRQRRSSDKRWEGRTAAEAPEVIDRLASADAIVVGSPVYKGSYTGLFKHFFDLIEPQRLTGLPVILTASGGGDRHALVVEHQLRPLFGFFSSHTIATSIYASEPDFADGHIRSEPLRQRIEAAVSDLAIWLDHGNHFKLTSAEVSP